MSRRMQLLASPVAPSSRSTSGTVPWSLHVVQSCGPWSCRPQPLGCCRETAPCEDTRQEHGSQFKCRMMSPRGWGHMHGVAGCRLMVPHLVCAQVQGCSTDDEHLLSVGSRTVPTPPRGGTEEEESKRSAASERTPLSLRDTSFRRGWSEDYLQ